MDHANIYIYIYCVLCVDLVHFLLFGFGRLDYIFIAMEHVIKYYWYHMFLFSFPFVFFHFLYCFSF